MGKPFEHAHALVKMWDAYDRSPADAWGCKLPPGHPCTIAFIEASAVVMAMSRTAEAYHGISMNHPDWLHA